MCQGDMWIVYGKCIRDIEPTLHKPVNLGSFKPSGKLFGQNNTTQLYMIIKFNIYSNDKGVVWEQVS